MSNQKTASRVAFTDLKIKCRCFQARSGGTKNLKSVVVNKTDDQILKTAHDNCFWAVSFFDVGFTDDDAGQKNQMVCAVFKIWSSVFATTTNFKFLASSVLVQKRRRIVFSRLKRRGILPSDWPLYTLETNFESHN